MLSAGRNGLTGLLLIGAVLYFTGAGSWLMARISNLGATCYTTLGQHFPSAAAPVCNSVSMAMQSVVEGVDIVHIKASSFYYSLLGSGSQQLNDLLARAGTDITQLTSSRDTLQNMMAQGPAVLARRFSAGNPAQAFQQSVDSFAIGQRYMEDEATISQAVPWLEYGASQPMGFGVMSQLALGKVYATGAPGIQPNPRAAEQYLIQAKYSIQSLRTSNSAQAQQILGTLGGDPKAVAAQIENMVRQIKAVGP